MRKIISIALDVSRAAMKTLAVAAEKAAEQDAVEQARYRMILTPSMLNIFLLMYSQRVPIISTQSKLNIMLLKCS